MGAKLNTGEQQVLAAAKYLKEYIQKERQAFEADIREKYAQLAELMDQGKELLNASAAALIQLQNEALDNIAALHAESLEKLEGKANLEIEHIRAERDRAIAEIRKAGNIEQEGLKQSALGALEIING